MANPPKTDEELMEAYQDGDTAAFNELYERYSGKVYAYLSSRVFNKSERDDVFQAIFLKLHKSRHLYIRHYLLAPWLFTICRTTFLDYLKAKKLPTVSHTDLEKIGSVPSETLSVSNTIGELSEKQKAALQMRYGDGLNFLEIANRLATSSMNVRQLISRALKKIRRPQ